MDRQKDWRIDPQLAEAFSRRQERLNEAELARLRESGQIAERGISKMGDVLSQGMNRAYDEYKQGRQRGREESFDKVKYDRLRVEDEYWNGPWDGGGMGSGAGPGGSRVGAIPGAESGPRIEGPGSGHRQAVAPQGMAEDDGPTYRQVKPAQSFSPGAVAVLEGRAKPGFNPAVREFSNPTLDYVGGRSDTSQYLGLNRPMSQPEPRGLNNVPPTNSAQGAASPSIGIGSGMGTAAGIGLAEDDGPRGDYRGNKTRLQHKWDLGLMKSEEEIRNMRKGKTGNERVAQWRDYGVDEQGAPLLMNQITGEVIRAPGITKRDPKERAVDPSKQALTEAQIKLIEARTKAARQPKAAGGGKGQFVTTVDENGEAIKKYVTPKVGDTFAQPKTSGTKSSAKQEFDNLPKDKQKQIEIMSTKVANYRTITNVLKSGLAQYRAAQNNDDRIRIANSMIKEMNSTMGADAVAAEEASRLADAMQFKSNLLGLEPGPRVGRDYSGFDRQVMASINKMSKATDMTQADIDKLYGRGAGGGGGAMKKPEEMTDEELAKELGQ